MVITSRNRHITGKTTNSNQFNYPSDHPGYSRVASKARFRALPAVFALLILLLYAQVSNASIDSPQGALDVAGLLPGRYLFMETPPKPIGPAEATVSSVKAIAGLMRQAIDVAAMLPDELPAKQVSPVSGSLSDAEVALKVATMLPIGSLGKSAPLALTSGKLLWPVDGLIYSAFNATRRRGRVHGAIDIVTKKNTPIAAAADGIVSVAANGGPRFKGYGKTVIIDHGNGVHTLYSHCSSILVKMGQRVKRGEFIATVGRTGSATTDHVHFEVRVAGKKRDPLNYLPPRPEIVKAKNWKPKS
ncbi:MAG: M23 family metallopeptidase [Synergistaceae bacterium]|jgi:murein DD-endopeptidase MepM/ murein hydrolase activator NlpD|nr:M23 family metallopeptidase [Synergistaceae bacterium]